MNYTEIILSFIIGGSVSVLLAFVFSLKSKGLIKLIVNIIAGCVALVVLNLFGLTAFKLNPLSAFIVGISGVPGLAVIFFIVTFL